MEWKDTFWTSLELACSSYSEKPTKRDAKELYDYIHGVHLLIPCSDARRSAKDLIRKYPVQPYLDSRRQVNRWLAFLREKGRRLFTNDRYQSGEARTRDASSRFQAKVLAIVGASALGVSLLT